MGAAPHRSSYESWQPARRRPSALGWALLWSLMLNHGLLLPGAYFLLFNNPPLPKERVLEVELEQASHAPGAAKLPRLARRPERKDVRFTAKPPEPKPPPLALEPPKPKPEPKPEPPAEKKKPEPPKPLAVPRLKMVEANTPESDRPPEDARYLSDKNRRVERETRARVTNLRRDDPRPKPTPAPEPDKRRLAPGAKQRRIAETKQSESLHRRPQQAQQRAARLLRMRQRTVAQRQRPQLAERSDNGALPLPQRRRLGDRGHQHQHARRPNLNLDHKAYDRIAGARAARERREARLSVSQPRGRKHQRKWQRVRAALENFVPEVQPGNQTALGTRAHPFAVFIARMHRRIHNLWGYGFLVDLDGKPDAHPMNNMRLWTMIEVVVGASGRVAKATIVKSSGLLTYDVAALDTIFAASPYPKPPRAVRSKDGLTYLHWRFHRDHRQCGTFGVDPYVLTKPPEGPIDGDTAEVGRSRVARLNRPQVPGRSTRAPRVGHRRHRHPHQHRGGGKASKARQVAARAAARARVSSSDPRARAAARRLVDGFAAGSARRMALACKLPFYSRGRKVAKTRAELTRMFGDLIREAPSSRRVEGLQLMTAMEARQRLGALPRGIRWGEAKLIGRVRLGGSVVTLILERQRGSWRISGLDR